MNISLIDNGLDSLEKAYDHLKKYEKVKAAGKGERERFFLLKDVTLAVQHGVEILFKCLLRDINEILIYSEVNAKYKQACVKRRAGEIAELYEYDGVHTVSFSESIDRLVDICDVEIDGKLKANLLKVQKWRNSITHSSATLNEYEVSSVLSKFMVQLDVFFSKALGDKYTGSQNKKKLDKAFESYTAVHGAHSNRAKHEAIGRLVSALEENNINDVTCPGVFLVDSPKVACAILRAIQGGEVSYGFDMANMHCSGESEVVGISPDDVLSIWAKDNMCEYQIGISGMVVYIPEIDGNMSPLIYIYSGGLPELGDTPYLREFDGTLCQRGFRTGGHDCWAKAEYIDFAEGKDETEEWLLLERFISSGGVCFMNVQTLDYGKADSLMGRYPTAQELYDEFRKALAKKK